MLKKLLIAAVAVLVGLTVVTSPTWVGSLLRTKWKDASAWCRQQVPVETEIQRLRDEVARLSTVSKTHFSALAEETVAVENLRKDIATLEANLTRQKKNVLALKEDLASNTEMIKYGDRTYSRDQVKTQLARDFEGYRTAEENLKAKRSLLEAKEASLSAAREQMKAMQDARVTLEDKLARLEAEIKKVRVAQTKSKLQFDDSELSRVKADVAALEDRIKVEQRKLELQAEYSHAPIPLTERVKEKDLVKDIEDHFGQGDQKVVTEKK